MRAWVEVQAQNRRVVAISYWQWRATPSLAASPRLARLVGATEGRRAPAAQELLTEAAAVSLDFRAKLGRYWRKFAATRSVCCLDRITHSSSRRNSMTSLPNSVGRAQHSTPSFTLYARVAAGFVGRLSRPAPSLHLALVIDDGYSITVIDGQPTGLEAGLRNTLRIRTNISTTELPTRVIKTIPLRPPAGMSPDAFARALVNRARGFASYTSPYNFPRGLRGSTMDAGEFNSNSYLAGLFHAVTGRVPQVHVPGYQIPGWESPMPQHFFKGEAMR